MFPIVNISGGIGDFYFFIRLILLKGDDRLAWANSSEKKILKTIIWKKEINPKKTIQE